MNKYLACTAALMMPLALCAQAMAQTAQPGATGMAPAGSMAHSTMAPGAMSTGTMAPGTMAPPAGMAGAMTPGSTAALSATDKKFVMKAAQGGTAEVSMAQLAQQKTQTDSVKQYAQSMIDDHTPNNAQLMKLASAKGLMPSTAPDAMQQKMMTRLQGLDGKKFDTAYLKGQIRSHEAMLKTFQDESKNGTDPDLKSFADATIPTIQKHITMASTGKTGTM